MSIARIRPTLALDAAVDAAFDDLVRSLSGATTGWVPAADVLRDGDDLVIVMELPGVGPNDVDIELHGRRLTIKGQRKETFEAHPVRRELRVGQFARSFRLPPAVTGQSVSASLDAGLLTVRIASALPRPEVTRITVTSGPTALPAVSDETVSAE